MGLFTDMKKFGLDGYDDTSIYESPVTKVIEQVDPTPNLSKENLFYDKKIECPVCGKLFIIKVLRSGVNPIVTKDTDLKPTFKHLDSALYDVIHCSCGYTALSKQFLTILPAQKELDRKSVV